ncbi:hypothetical protein NL676_034240 [Syzygium grande]|nr:hypothetical protein NL676_034240 [Syzygium grande]
MAATLAVVFPVLGMIAVAVVFGKRRRNRESSSTSTSLLGILKRPSINMRRTESTQIPLKHGRRFFDRLGIKRISSGDRKWGARVPARKRSSQTGQAGVEEG